MSLDGEATSGAFSAEISKSKLVSGALAFSEPFSIVLVVLEAREPRPLGA